MLTNHVICYKIKQKLANIYGDRYKVQVKFLILKKTVTYWGIQNRGIKYKLKTLVQKLENTRC